MSDFLWEDPPADRQGAPRTTPQVIAAQLRAKPGQWARIAIKSQPSMASSAALHIRRATLAAYLPQGSFEAVSRTVWVQGADGDWRPSYRVYARFVGVQ